eukprot:scaffold221701_cov30-Tisochrysis_lutea.AAC.1
MVSYYFYALTQSELCSAAVQHTPPKLCPYCDAEFPSHWRGDGGAPPPPSFIFKAYIGGARGDIGRVVSVAP